MNDELQEAREHPFRVMWMFVALAFCGFLLFGGTSCTAPSAPTTTEERTALLENPGNVQPPDFGDLHTALLGEFYPRAWEIFVQYVDQGVTSKQMWENISTAWTYDKSSWPSTLEEAKQWMSEIQGHPLFWPVEAAFSKAYGKNWSTRQLREELLRIGLPSYAADVGVSSYELQLDPPCPMLDAGDASVVGAADAIGAAIGGVGAPLTAPAASGTVLVIAIIHNWMED